MSVRTRLTVLGAGAVLGSATVLGIGAAPALACAGGEPLAAPPTAPSASAVPSGSAAPSGPVPTADLAAGAVLRLLPPTPGTLVAGGDPVGFTAEIANTGTGAFTGVVPLAAVRGDGVRGDGAHGDDGSRDPRRALRAEEVLFQVRTPAGWERVPLAADCDGALLGGPAAPTADLAPGGTARYAFRLSVPAPGPGVGELDVRLGVRSAAGDGFRDAPHLVLPLAPAAGPGVPSATAAAAATGPGDTVPGSAPVPHTEALGVAVGPAPVPSDSPVPTVTLSPAGAAARLSTPAEAGRPPLSLLISGVALITLGAVGLTLVLTNRR
ncbi:hypothetical protein ACIQBJ_00975 [Kitasatospora sp. NPDC088391]|uniref:hypothetical protein n=1 Tax=Kitasatospora sp. NPDC088391 TaxID=3364074 RepID=UPI0038147912